MIVCELLVMLQIIFHVFSLHLLLNQPIYFPILQHDVSVELGYLFAPCRNQKIKIKNGGLTNHNHWDIVQYLCDRLILVVTSCHYKAVHFFY